MAMAWTSPAFMKVEKGEVDLKLNYFEMGIVAAVPFCGRLFSPIPMSYVMDCVGRRGCLIIGRALQLLHWLLIYVTYNVWVLYVSRFINGWYSGMAMFVISVYISETAHKKIRGRTQAILNILFTLGTVFESAIGAVLSYDNLIITSAAVDMFTFLFMFMIPESPYYHLSRDQHEAAKESLIWLRGEDVTRELNRIEKHLSRQMSESTNYSFIFRQKATRKAFIILQILLIIQRSSGMTAIVAFASFVTPDTWWLPNDSGPIALNMTYLITCAISSIFVDKWGRKKFLAFSSFGTSIFMSGCAIWFYMEHSDNYDVTGTEWVPIVMLMLQAAFFSTGYFYIPSILMSEMFPMNIKAKATALGAMTATLFSTVVVFIFLPVSNAYGMYVNFIIYSCAMIVGGIYSMTIIETKGRTLEAIQAILEGRVPSESSMSMQPQADDD